MKKIFTLFTLILTVSISTFAQVATWDFTGQSSPATSTASTFDGNLTSAPVLTRGGGAASSAASNSFRTTGFGNDAIATTNTDYFQVTLSAAAGFKLSLSTIDARLNGTTSYAAAPGVSNQFAYSLDGTNFTLIGTPSVTTGAPVTLPTVSLSGISQLQNVLSGTIVTLRYYASGQTNTGGWGFASNPVNTPGFSIGGSVTTTVVAFSSAGELNAIKSSNKTNLTWSLGCNADRCTYELQRSANGVSFNALKSETVTPAQCAAPFSFTDAQPLSGVNYYRIKVTDLDGSFSYSKIASVRFNGSEPIKVIPTIAVNDVKVYYESAASGNSTWVVYDMSGRIVSKSNVNLLKGQNTITINVSNLLAGQYQISGITETGKTDAVKIIKQ